MTTKLGTKRKCKNCVGWEHDKSKCYDIYEEHTYRGKKIKVWVNHCSASDKLIGDVMSKVFGGQNDN